MSFGRGYVHWNHGPPACKCKTCRVHSLIVCGKAARLLAVEPDETLAKFCVCLSLHCGRALVRVRTPESDCMTDLERLNMTLGGEILGGVSILSRFPYVAVLLNVGDIRPWSGRCRRRRGHVQCPFTVAVVVFDHETQHFPWSVLCRRVFTTGWFNV